MNSVYSESVLRQEPPFPVKIAGCIRVLDTVVPLRLLCLTSGLARSSLNATEIYNFHLSSSESGALSKNEL